MKNNKSINDYKLIRPGRVCELWGISMTTLYRYINDDPDFPPRIRLGKNGAVAFREDQMIAYLQRNTESKAQEVEK